MPSTRPKSVMTLRPLPMAKIEVGSTNVRRREITADLDTLARSLDEIGLQQPLVVQPRNGRFEVLVGQRRFLAAKKLGWSEIASLVPDPPFDETTAVIVSLSENVHRRDLEPQDKAEAIDFLLGQFDGSVQRVAEELGLSEPTVRKWRGYRAVPESLRQLVREKQISAPVAIKISQSLPDEDRALRVARHIAEHQPPRPERDRILDA